MTRAIRWLSAITVVAAVSCLLSACGGPPGAPAVSAFPLVRQASVLESGSGPSDQGLGMYPGQSRWMFVRRAGVSPQDLMVQEVRRLRRRGWQLVGSRRLDQQAGIQEKVPVEHATDVELVSAAARLRVDLYPIHNIGEAHDHVDDSESTLTIGPGLRRAAGHDGLLYVDLRGRSVP